MKAGIVHSFFAVLILINYSNAYAQVENRLEIDKCARLEGGLILAGQVSNDNLIYNPGGNFQYSYCIKSGGNAGFGLGAGVQFFDEEAFIPFYIDFIELFNKSKNSPFLTFQGGYALGWSNLYKNIQRYSYNGGFCFSCGIGRKFRFNDTFSSYISFSYKHQFATLSYQTNAVESYREILNYDMLTLSIGIMLEQ
jgi:hypothetical protein